jgi:SagB-type dehydrogenase family enzyme
VGRVDRIREYHERTKHSIERLRANRHFLDWDNEPARFKEYVGLEPEALPPFRPSGVAAHEAVAASAAPSGEERLDLEVLSHLLFHAGGISRTLHTAMGEFHFRTYASAGALYPIETYVVAGRLPDLEAGVYHYAPRRHGLRRLRRGDHRGALGVGGHPPAAAAVVFSGIPWRTAWKYTARGFRHLYWDTGTMLANLLAAAAARRVPARVVLGFVDEAADRLLGLGGRDEFALCLVLLGHAQEEPERVAEVVPLQLATAAVSPRPRSDPEIEAARESVRLEDEDAVNAFRAGDPGSRPDGRPTVDRAALGTARLTDDPFESVVARRGSSRRLWGDPIPAAEYTALVDAGRAGLPADWRGPGPAPMVSAHALNGLPPGSHELLPGGGFRTITEGRFRVQAAHLCLDQRLGGDAAATTFLTADLDAYLRAFGARGYAAAQLEAAVAAGRMYLGAYAQCLGASGITFYDDEVRSFFRTDEEPMLAVVMGREGRRRDLIRCRHALEKD